MRRRRRGAKAAITDPSMLVQPGSWLHEMADAVSYRAYAINQRHAYGNSQIGDLKNQISYRRTIS
jgi:hypothetical protein